MATGRDGSYRVDDLPAGVYEIEARTAELASQRELGLEVSAGGEVVVDLGSGGGLDVFLATQAVGSTGQAIGIDMTDAMLELARRNAKKGDYSNVKFLKGQIDSLPLADQLADIIISNCVINLAPDKKAVFREMFRVLKPGGRVAVSDIALKQPLPEEIRESVAALVGCIAGAISFDEYQQGLAEAGFEHVTVLDTQADLTAYAQVEAQSCCSSGTVHDSLSDLMARYDVNAYAASVKVFALKPSA